MMINLMPSTSHLFPLLSLSFSLSLSHYLCLSAIVFDNKALSGRRELTKVSFADRSMCSSLLTENFCIRSRHSSPWFKNFVFQSSWRSSNFSLPVYCRPLENSTGLPVVCKPWNVSCPAERLSVQRDHVIYSTPLSNYLSRNDIASIDLFMVVEKHGNINLSCYCSKGYTSMVRISSEVFSWRSERFSFCLHSSIKFFF